MLDEGALARLIEVLRADGYVVVGPSRRGEAVTLASIGSLADLVEAGWVQDSRPGVARLRHDATAGRFAHGVSAPAWKSVLYPARERLWHGERRGGTVVVAGEAFPTPPLALLGVTACDLAALRVLDRVLIDSGADPAYAWRRRYAMIVAVNCTRVADTCFCASMGSGPGVDGGADIVLTEVPDEAGALMVAEAGSERGRAILARCGVEPAPEETRQRAAASVTAAASNQRRAMVDNVAEVLRRSRESRRWDGIAERCLTCGNCTLVCPTCFCARVEDESDLSGDAVERWRHWDSCFSIDFSYIHGGSIRRSPASRYRQWLTHKLSAWWEQFGTSGCVGCGRCIAWCPVGIDLTEEAAAFRDDEARM